MFLLFDVKLGEATSSGSMRLVRMGQANAGLCRKAKQQYPVILLLLSADTSAHKPRRENAATR